MNELEINEESIKGLLGQPTDISELDPTKKNSFSEIAFNLYKETVIVATVAAHLYESTNAKEFSLSRNQAIEAGLAVRITKYMAAVLALQLDKVREHGEVIMSLNRCITESAVNLIFFCEKGTPEDYDQYVKSSLKPERDLYKTIEKNITKRGKTLPIEKRMLNSVIRVFQSSEIKSIEELGKIPKRKKYSQILEAIDWDSVYPMLQGVPSHSIHGTWVDLVLHHLEKTDAGFKPKPKPVTPDTRLLCPISILVLRAVHSYVNKNFSNTHTETLLLSERIKDLIDRIGKVDDLHEKSLNQ